MGVKILTGDSGQAVFTTSSMHNCVTMLYNFVKYLYGFTVIILPLYKINIVSLLF